MTSSGDTDEVATLDWWALLMIIGPGLAVILLCILIVAVGRLICPMVYEPRTRFAMPMIEDISRPLSKNPFAAFWQVVTTPLAELVETVGLDAVAYTSTSRTLLYVICSWMIMSLALLPFYCPGNYWTEAAEETGTANFVPLTQCSITNIPRSSDRLWATVVGTYAFAIAHFIAVGIDLWFIQNKMTKYQRHRRPPRYYTCMVSDIPEDERDARSLTEWFKEQGFTGIAHVSPMRLLGADFYKDLRKYESSWVSLQRARREEATTGETAWLRLPWPECCTQVPAVDHHSQELQELRPVIEGYQRDHESFEEHSVAFVTFDNLTEASEAFEKFEYGHYDRDTLRTGWRVEPAPEPRDIYWRSLEMAAGNVMFHFGGRCWLWWATFGVIITWIIPILGVQALRTWLLNWDNLLASALLSFLPSLLLVIVNALGTMVLRLVARASGLFEKSLVQHFWMWQCFLFLIIDSFIITFFVGSFLIGSTSYGSSGDGSGDVDLSDPIHRLGEAMPRAASFYFVYILSQAFYGIVLGIAFPWALISTISNRAWSLQGRDKEVAMAPSHPQYAQLYAYDAFVYSITFCFGLFAPLVLVAGFIFHLLSHICYKYKLMYNYRSEFQAEGELALPAAAQVLLGLFVGELGVFAVVLVKGAWSSFFLIPLMVITLLLIPALPFIYKPLYEKGLDTSLCREFDDEAAAGSKKQIHARDTAIKAAKDGVWSQPRLRENLDHPFPNRFFWRDLKKEKGSSDEQDFDDSSDEAEILDALVEDDRGLSQSRQSVRDMMVRPLATRA
mmetsp:Transcript_61566/g.146885  ORF Transcript_61566/g.146885 Transcript_61566/m.146885 type:complete len:787 (+) Transcript_61566:86-2446(+)